MSDHPIIYHPGVHSSSLSALKIQDDLSYRIAKLLWDDIAAKYEPKAPLLTPEISERISAIIKKHTEAKENFENSVREDDREQSLARSVIPSDEIQKAPVKEKKPAKKPVRQPHQSRKGIPNWTQEEELLIQSATSRNEAWTLFNERLPGQRNANAVKQKWSKMQAPKKKDLPKEIAINDHVKQTHSSIPSGIGVVTGKDKDGRYEVNFGKEGRFTFMPEHLEVV